MVIEKGWTKVGIFHRHWMQRGIVSCCVPCGGRCCEDIDALPCSSERDKTSSNKVAFFFLLFFLFSFRFMRNNNQQQPSVSICVWRSTHRFCTRMMPIQMVTHANPSELKSVAQPFIDEFFGALKTSVKVWLTYLSAFLVKMVLLFIYFCLVWSGLQIAK